MAMEQRKPSRGAFRVGLLALHDQKFFARLLDNPRQALKDVEQKLHLTGDDMKQVEELIRKQLSLQTAQSLLAALEHYHKTGLLLDGDWADLWKER